MTIEEFEQLMKPFSETVKKICFLRYLDAKTQKETGELLGIHPKMISRIEKTTLHQIKEMRK